MIETPSGESPMIENNPNVVDFPDNTPLEDQVKVLGDILMDEFGGPTQSEGAVGMAIRLLREQRDAKRDSLQGNLYAFEHDYERERRDHLRSAARELLSRAHINLSRNIEITGAGHDRTITATFNAPVGPEVPTIAGISISVRFGWATCDEALKGLDAALTVITSSLQDVGREARS